VFKSSSRGDQDRITDRRAGRFEGMGKWIEGGRGGCQSSESHLKPKVKGVGTDGINKKNRNKGKKLKKISQYDGTRDLLKKERVSSAMARVS